MSEIEKEIENVIVDDDNEINKKFKDKYNEKNGFYISPVASTGDLKEEILNTKDLISNSMLWNDKKTVETIHDFRVCVRQKVRSIIFSLEILGYI
jgi:hypothetical protein